MKKTTQLEKLKKIATRIRVPYIPKARHVTLPVPLFPLTLLPPNNKTPRRRMPRVPKATQISFETSRERAFEKAWGLSPLRDIVQEALGVLNPNPPARYEELLIDAEWLAGIALRAVAKAVIRQRCVPLPLRVDLNFAGPEEGYINSIGLPPGDKGKVAA